MSEVCSDKMASNQFFSIGNDSTDPDFIQAHVDSLIPPADSEEVMDEDFDESLNREGDDGIPDFIWLIPWTGFETGETGELPKEITYTNVIVPRAAGASKKVNVYSN